MPDQMGRRIEIGQDTPPPPRRRRVPWLFLSLCFWAGPLPAFAQAAAGVPVAATPDHHSRFLQPALTLAAGGLLAAWARDEESPDATANALDRSGLDKAFDFGNFYGDGLLIGGGSLATFAVGHLSGHEKTARIGNELCETFLLSSAASGALKYSVNRRRPSGGSHSFPSGHTTVAFSVVPILQRHLGWRAALPAALLATATAFGRMEDRRHFRSDVIAGAALGLACGEIVASGGILPGHTSVIATGDGLGFALPF